MSAQAAALTGRQVQIHAGLILYEGRCPNCDMPQFHQQGIARCIACDQRFSIVVITLMPPVNSPDVIDAMKRRSNKEIREDSTSPHPTAIPPESAEEEDEP